MHKKILFVCYGGGHVAMLIPIIEKLKQTRNDEVLVLGLTTASTILDNKNISYIQYKDLLKHYDEQPVIIGRELARTIDIHPSVGHEETVAYLGLCYLDLQNSMGAKQAKSLYKKQGRQAFLPLRVMTNLIRHYQPDLIITTNAPRSERAAIMAANMEKVKSICLVDLYARVESAWIKANDFANAICVLNQSVKDYFISLKRNPSHIYVTGNPAFLELFQPHYKTLAIEYRYIKKLQNKKIILWASQPEPAFHPFIANEKSPCPNIPELVEQELINLLKLHSEWHLIIRPHPSDKRYMTNVNHCAANIRINQNSNELPILLHAADVVVTLTSTVGVQAAYLGKPVISITKTVFQNDLPLDNMGLAIGVNDLKNLENALLLALSGNWSPNHDMPTGNATDVIMTIIEKMLV